MTKKIILITIIAVIVLTGISVAKGQYRTIEVFIDQIQLRINGQYSSTQPTAMIYKGTVYLPIRTISETLGGEVTWDGLSRTVDLDFLEPQSDSFIAATNITIYQYIAIEKNQIMEQLNRDIKNSQYKEMMNQIQKIHNLEELANNLGDTVLEEYLNKMSFAAEIIRSGLETKVLGLDYKLATNLFIESEKLLSAYIKVQLAKE